MKKRKKIETIEDVIRMAARVSKHMAKDGVHLVWTVRYEPMFEMTTAETGVNDAN